jgi:hypothetical protein
VTILADRGFCDVKLFEFLASMGLQYLRQPTRGEGGARRRSPKTSANGSPTSATGARVQSAPGSSEASLSRAPVWPAASARL